ncbi:hypothetical protein BH20BAC1_BH20BAC1_07780 [soil metagenome]
MKIFLQVPVFILYTFLISPVIILLQWMNPNSDTGRRSDLSGIINDMCHGNPRVTLAYDHNKGTIAHYIF